MAETVQPETARQWKANRCKMVEIRKDGHWRAPGEAERKRFQPRVKPKLNQDRKVSGRAGLFGRTLCKPGEEPGLGSEPNPKRLSETPLLNPG
jgi:hypothetical protein